MKSGDTINLLVETAQTHAALPWPATAPQTAPQLLRYFGNLFILTPYETKSQRTKYRGGDSFTSFTEPHNVDEYATESGPPVSRSGTTVTYGQFNNVPATATKDFIDNKQQRVELRYEYKDPVLTATSLKRSAEISHWGSNLNIQDEIKLRNDGPM